MNFLRQVKKEDDMLYEVSQKFTDLTQECKNILDKIKDKSEERKAKYGVSDDDKDSAATTHHKPFPPHIKDALRQTTEDVSFIISIRFLIILSSISCKSLPISLANSPMKPTLPS